MKHNIINYALIGCLLGSHNSNAQDSRERTYQYEILNPKHEIKTKVEGFATKRVVEQLDRGLAAIRTDDGKSVYLSWRLLDSDEKTVSFNVYRLHKGKSKKLNRKPIVATCDFIDTTPFFEQAAYYIRTVIKNKERDESQKLKIDFSTLGNYKSIKLQGTDKAGKVAVADLNGDGQYDFIVRTPDSNTDPGMPGDKAGTTFKISAYLHNGTHLWTHDMGPGIEPGIWYSPFVVFDFDGDGKAEVAIKGSGNNYIRNVQGRVSGGDEYLLVLDGTTGKIIDKVDWPERNYRYGDLNRQNRNQMGMAYLDGTTPCILAARGTYRLMVVDAWQLKNGKMEKLWRWDGDEENPVVRSQGAHNMVAGDVDGDGRDEILLGSCMLDDDGTLLWSTGLGHSDKAYLTKINPKLEGMQVFLVSEPWQTDGRGVMVADAKTGSLIWKLETPTRHVGDGMVADFDPASPGLECFASEDAKGGSTDKYLLSSDGKKLNTIPQDVPGCRNWVWWDADLLRETIAGDDNRWGAGSTSVGRKLRVIKYKSTTLTENIQGDIVMIADIMGDWREELITTLRGEIRIYQTSIPARDRRITLMQDPIYRSYVLQRSQGYPQSPVPGYYLGE